MPDPIFRFVAPSTGERLDRLVADETGCGRRTAKRWLQGGNVRVNGHVAGASDIAAAGSEIVVSSNDESFDDVPPPPALDVVLEDEHVLVVNKPAGVHCERGRSAGSVADLLEERYGDLRWIGDRPEEAGLVHRIDRDTSGAVVVARDRPTYRRLREAFRVGATRKQYLALAAGYLAGPIDVDLSLSRRAGRMAPATRFDDAIAAHTMLAPLDGGEDWTLVLATMSSGAMHQVRVHMAAIGHPLLGDRLYGGPQPAASLRDGQLLHAMRVQVAGEIDVTVRAPTDFLHAYSTLKREGAVRR
ncbi:MAG: pseudouridine synthase [Candidatus Binatia bacterium]